MENNLVMHNIDKKNSDLKHNNIHIIFLLYWTILVLYENMNFQTSRLGIDLLVKVLLIGMLTIYCLLKIDKISKKILIWIFLTLSMTITFVIDNHFYINNIISYVYPILYIFLTLILGEKNQINKKQLLFFLNWIILLVTIMTIYTIIFEFNKIISMFTITTAYGNQLKSFLSSSHEYALYLCAGIISSLICFKYSRKKIKYLLSIVLFALVLILTYSRTFILGMISFVFIYILFLQNKKCKTCFIIVGIISLLLILFIPLLKNFIFQIVLKNNNSAGRNILYSTALKYFGEGNLIEKVWGHGIYASRNYFEFFTTHPSVHNTYLQILIYYGIVGELFFIIFIIFQIYNCIKAIKYNKYLGVIIFAILIFCIVVMSFDTTYIFDSQCPSFFLTFFAIIIPKYMINAINENKFD